LLRTRRICDVLELSKLQEAVRHEGRVSRRLFLAYSAGLAAIPLLGRQALAKPHQTKFVVNPFGVGVASGDPTADGVVLWTRLAPQPLDLKAGMEPHNVEVAWELAEDDAMRRIIRRGRAIATPELAHSVHVEVDGLAPDRWYWYRFHAGDADSPIGRTRTVPAAEMSPQKLQFAFASCQDYEDGYYTAYEHMATDELDLVIHLGDYIYENAPTDGLVRKNVGKELESLDDYRLRYAQYKSDPLLQGMHARCPWIVTWDDHEVVDDYAGEFTKEPVIDPVKFLVRRAAAYQAYYETMPLRKASLPRGPSLQLYRKTSFGRLAEFLVLDTRQYRTDQSHAGERHNIDDLAMSPKATILGGPQMQWLQSSLAESPARWNVLAQQVLMAMVVATPRDKQEFSMEKWTGYMHDRQSLLQFLADRRISNPIVLSGDIHSNWVNDLRVDDRNGETPIVVTEFVGTSISSGGNGVDKPEGHEVLLAENPCVRFHNQQRGYVRCTITPKLWRSDYRTVADVTKPGAPAETRASFVVEAGQPGANPA
jgi:alkaline phosphatase D